MENFAFPGVRASDARKKSQLVWNKDASRSSGVLIGTLMDVIQLVINEGIVFGEEKTIGTN